MGHQLPSYDKIYHNASKGIIELVVLEDGITVKDDEECIGGEDSFQQRKSGLQLYEGYSHHAAPNQNSIQLQKLGNKSDSALRDLWDYHFTALLAPYSSLFKYRYY